MNAPDTLADDLIIGAAERTDEPHPLLVWAARVQRRAAAGALEELLDRTDGQERGEAARRVRPHAVRDQEEPQVAEHGEAILVELAHLSAMGHPSGFKAERAMEARQRLGHDTRFAQTMGQRGRPAFSFASLPVDAGVSKPRGTVESAAQEGAPPQG